ncbi:MAG: M24 family metallopeptidase [Promethearchaeota archaeon]
MTTQFDFKKRLSRVQDALKEYPLDAIILMNTRNIYWLTGSAQASHLIVLKDMDPVLLVRRNIELSKAHSWFPAEWIKPLKATADTVKELKNCLEKQGKKDQYFIGMELSGLPVTFYFKFEKLLGKGIKINNVSGLLRNLRMIKDAGEIERIEKAAKVAEKTQEAVYKITMEDFKPGITERDVAAEMAYVAKKNRAEHFCIYDNNMFTNFNNFFIVTSGESLWTPSTFPIMSGAGFSPAIPYGASDRELKEGDILVCDYGIIVDGYHADHARTFAIGNKYPKYFKERYRNMLDAYKATLDDIEVGQPASSIFNTMLANLKKLDDPKAGLQIEKYFQGNGTYYQALGHGIGLELDEPPFITRKDNTILQDGMTISIEPKIMIPGWGAINLEDNFLIRKGKKVKQFTNTRYIDV